MSIQLVFAGQTGSRRPSKSAAFGRLDAQMTTTTRKQTLFEPTYLAGGDFKMAFICHMTRLAQWMPQNFRRLAESLRLHLHPNEAK